MAKLTFGPLISEARNKCGGVVFSRSRGGATSRAVPTFTQPITTDVATVRSQMAAIGKLWYATLTEDQRQRWRTFGSQLRWTDVFHQPVTPAGSDVFSQLNFNAVNAGGTYILDPPGQLSAQDPGPISATATADDMMITITPTVPLPSGHGIRLMASPPLNSGWYFVDKFLRQLRGYPPATPATTLPLVRYQWLAKFTPPHGVTPKYLWPPAPGQKLAFSLAYVNLATGAISPAQTTTCIIQEGITMQSVKVSITAAQLLTIGTSPIQLIPAPPPGYSINAFYLRADLAFKTTPYNVAGMSSYLYGFCGTRPTAAQAALAYAMYIHPSWLTAAANSHYTSNSLGATAPVFTDNGQPFMFGPPSDQATNPTLGDSTLTVQILFTIYPTS